MTPNRSSAAITKPNQSASVMQQNAEPHGSLGDFPTPPWATRALLNRLYQTPGKWLKLTNRHQNVNNVEQA